MDMLSWGFVLVTVLFIGGLSLSGCISLKEGGKVTDYALIEVGSYAAMIIGLDKAGVTSDVKEQVKEYLNFAVSAVEVDAQGELLTLDVVSKILHDKIPHPYGSIASLAITLIESRVEVNLTESQEKNAEIVLQITRSVLAGAIRALKGVS